MIIDTHAHLTDEKYKGINLLDILDRAEKNGVNKIITVGTGLEDNKKALKIAESFPNVYASIGLFPNDTIDESQVGDREKLIELESSLTPDVIAIGECGLDYADAPPCEVKRSQKDQIKLFESQLDIARKHNLPIIIHSRNATKDTLDILSSLNKENQLKGVWHCFTESINTARSALDMGIKISFTGIITYPSAIHLRKVVEYVPLNSIMIETDSPLLPPQAVRKKNIKINEPAYVKMIAEEISAIKNVDFETIANATTKVAEDLFNL